MTVPKPTAWLSRPPTPAEWAAVRTAFAIAGPRSIPIYREELVPSRAAMPAVPEKGGPVR